MSALKLNYKKISLGLFLLLFQIVAVKGQSFAILSADATSHNFGFVQEDAGIIKHTFHLKNTGNAPLVIHKVTVSCGCTLAQWSQAPIDPGETGIVEVSFNPLGRPGPFFKTVMVRNNSPKPNVQLSISGQVQTRKHKENKSNQLPYSLGPLKIEEKHWGFNAVPLGVVLEEKVKVYNNTEQTITPTITKKNRYFSIKFIPETIEPKQEGIMLVQIDGKKIRKPGRIDEEIHVTFKEKKSTKEQESIQLYANIIENYTRWSKMHKRNAAHAELSSNNLILMLEEHKRYKNEFTIKNNGKKPLKIYSLTTDNKEIQIKGLRKTIKPGKLITISISIKEKNFIHKVEGNIILNCNDPNGPIKIIKYKAQK